MGILKVDAAIFLVSLGGVIASVSARQYWATVPYAFVTLASVFILWIYAGTGYGNAYDYGWDQGSAAALREAEGKRHQEAEARKPCEITFEDVRTWPGEGHLYILRFSTNVIKVGQTLDLQRRVREHRRDAEAFGAVIVDYWFSPAHQNYLENEVELILGCDESATWRSKREYFQGIDIDEVIEFACGLTYYTASATTTEEVKA